MKSRFLLDIAICQDIRLSNVLTHFGVLLFLTASLNGKSASALLPRTTVMRQFLKSFYNILNSLMATVQRKFHYFFRMSRVVCDPWLRTTALSYGQRGCFYSEQRILFIVLPDLESNTVSLRSMTQSIASLRWTKVTCLLKNEKHMSKKNQDRITEEKKQKEKREKKRQRRLFLLV